MKKRSLFTIVFLSLFLLACSCWGKFFGEFGVFLSIFVKEPKKIGSVIPSSRFLSESITRHIDNHNASIKILEVGAGTGVFTETIIEKMGEHDFLDVVEIDPGLCEILKQKFQHYNNVCIKCVSILDWEPSFDYDFIISGLPFNAFEPEFVDLILDKYKTLIKDKGVLSYFEYMWLPKIKEFFLAGKKKISYLKNIDIRSNFRNDFQFAKDVVFLNIPPAKVYHLRIQKSY